MFSFVSNLIGPVEKEVNERLKSPLTSALLISFSITNWRLIYTLVGGITNARATVEFVNATYLGVDFSDINSYWGWVKLLVLPPLFAGAYFKFYLPISASIYGSWLDHRNAELVLETKKRQLDVIRRVEHEAIVDELNEQLTNLRKDRDQSRAEAKIMSEKYIENEKVIQKTKQTFNYLIESKSASRRSVFDLLKSRGLNDLYGFYDEV